MKEQQRRFDRIRDSFEVACRRYGALSETWRPVTIIDLSAGGLAFESQELFEAGESVEIRIRLPSSRAPLQMRAQVVRGDPEGLGRCRCAVEFVELTPDQQAEIDGLVQFLRTPPASS